MAWVYAMYKGEELLAIGTRDEICKQMKIKKQTFHFYRTKWYKKNKLEKGKKRRTIVLIDKE